MNSVVANKTTNTTLPNSAQVIIIGGGIVGCSVAYHLSKLGYKEIVLLERKQLTSGTTWHAAGLVPQSRNSVSLTKLVQYSGKLYTNLEAETGLATGFKRTGSLSLANTEERMHELQRSVDFARYNKTPATVLKPDEIHQWLPTFKTDDLVGAVYFPQDGQADPSNITMALAKGAKNNGVLMFENTSVTGILKKSGKLTGVQTIDGDIKADIVVNCGGMWAREIGKMAGVSIPLMSCEHYYIVTSNISNLPKNMPSVRVPDECGYYKEDAGKILFGLFEPKSKPWGVDGIPNDFCFTQLPEDYDHFMPFLEQAMQRLPVLNEVGIETFFNGPESFTPDDNFIIGAAPELENFYVLAGFNSIGIQCAGGAGMYLAKWIKDKKQPCDLVDVDVRRFHPFQSNKSYTAERASETLGLLYADHFPYRQKATARNIRKSPIHDLLIANGACMGEVNGWERANWFATSVNTTPQYEYSWWRQNWFTNSATEHLSLRHGVGMYDMSSFGKILVVGTDACDFLQFICANDINVVEGKIVYTQFLNHDGGIEADVTVTRLEKNKFLLVTGAANTIRDIDWLNKNKPNHCQCELVDYTSAEAVFCVMGPQAELFMEAVCTTDLSIANFPWANSRILEIGMGMVRAHRISYVGEDGWEIYVPTEFAVHTAETLLNHGKKFNLKLVGLHAMDSCRLEKSFRHFGHDITNFDHVLEAGLGFAVKTNKPISKFGNFIGRDAVLKVKQQGLTKRLVQFKLKDSEPLLHHNEVIFRNNTRVGYITSGNYGHCLGSAIGMGYIDWDSTLDQGEFVNSLYEIEIANKKFVADASLKSHFFTQQ